jgi:hypothetical protein
VQHAKKRLSSSRNYKKWSDETMKKKKIAAGCDEVMQQLRAWYHTISLQQMQKSNKSAMQ